MKRDIEELIEKHKPLIAERWRRLEKLLAEFRLVLEESQTPALNALPIAPIEIYPAALEEIKHDDGRTETIVTDLKKALPMHQGRRKAIDALTNVFYEGDEKANTIVRCYGVIGAPMHVIRMAKQINQAKSELRDAIAPVANKRVRVGIKDREGEPGETTRELTTLIFRQLQSARVNLLAAYRQIPIIEEPVTRIKFIHYRTRSVQQRTVGQVIEMLYGESKTPSEMGKQDIAILSTWPKNEHLSRPRPYYYRMRANVTLARRVQDKRRQQTTTVQAELPILFPVMPSMARPEIVKPNFGESPIGPKPKRLEDKTELKVYGFHRLKPEYRTYKKPKEAESKTG